MSSLPSALNPSQKRPNDSDQTNTRFKSRHFDLVKDLTDAQKAAEQIKGMTRPQLEGKIAEKKKVCEGLVKNLEDTLKDIQKYAMTRAQSELDLFCHLFDNEKESLQQLEDSLEKQKAEETRVQNLSWQNDALLKAQSGLIKEIGRLNELNTELHTSNQELQKQLDDNSNSKVQTTNRQLRKELKDKEAELKKAREQVMHYYNENLELKEKADTTEIMRQFGNAVEILDKNHDKMFPKPIKYDPPLHEAREMNGGRDVILELMLLKKKNLELEEKLRAHVKVEEENTSPSDPLSA